MLIYNILQALGGIGYGTLRIRESSVVHVLFISPSNRYVELRHSVYYSSSFTAYIIRVGYVYYIIMANITRTHILRAK